MSIVASTELLELTMVKAAGERVNAHVVQPAKEPEPDFAATRRLIEGKPDPAARPNGS